MIKGSATNKKIYKSMYLGLVAGILIITNGVILGVVAKWFIEIMPILPGSSGNDPTLLIELASVGLIFGVIVMVGALMLRFKPLNKKAWGIMIIVFSIPSVIMGGGFIVGVIIGLLAGRIALSKEPTL
jgi:hypothetical protein